MPADRLFAVLAEALRQSPSFKVWKADEKSRLMDMTTYPMLSGVGNRREQSGLYCKNYFRRFAGQQDQEIALRNNLLIKVPVCVKCDLLLQVIMADSRGVPNIIIAEEDEYVSSLMMATFKLEGFLPHPARTAQECLDKVGELGGSLDAIVINGRLASDRGKMLIVNIRNMNRKVKIFVLAERFEEEHKTRVLDYGADEFTVKPLSITTLVDKVNMLLVAGSPTKA